MGHAWVALLRAVNLGARNKVPMGELRALLAAAGFGDVRTYIASGNVLLTAESGDAGLVGRQVETTIGDAFGVTTTAIMRTFADLSAVADAHPFGADTSGSHVTFLADEPGDDALARLAALDVSPDELHVSGRDVFMRLPNGFAGSRVSASVLERHLGVPGTSRNWRTVARLAELCSTT
jgi:uncharacterized protein (DUF1697 family)